MPQNITEKTNPAWVAVTAPAQGDFIDPDAMAEDLSKLAERDAWLRLLIKNVCDPHGIVLSATETTGLLSALDARYFKNSQLSEQATDAEVAAAIVEHLAAADPHSQYALKSIALIRYPSGTTVPTVYAGDVIYIGKDKYEWIDGAYMRIKPISKGVNTVGQNTTTSCSVVVSVPRDGLLYITGTRNVSSIETSVGYFSRILLNGNQLSADTTRTTITQSVTVEVAKGTHTVTLEGQYFLAFSLWLSVLYVPN